MVYLSLGLQMPNAASTKSANELASSMWMRWGAKDQEGPHHKKDEVEHQHPAKELKEGADPAPEVAETCTNVRPTRSCR